jgi:hypothetical protein
MKRTGLLRRTCHLKFKTGILLRTSVHLLLPCFYLASTIAPYSAEFGIFDEEVRRFSSEVFCPTAKIRQPLLEGSGRVFACELGGTVQFAIHELGATGRVENIKVTWNDWLVDIGRGIHADRFEAELLVRMTARLYAPGADAELLEIFKTSKAQIIRKNGFLLKYTYDRGPNAADRMLTITKL